MAEKKTAKKTTGGKSIPPAAPAAATPPVSVRAKGGEGPASKRKGVSAPARTAPTVEAVPSDWQKEHSGFRRKIIGIVVSNKMAKTVVVEVIRKAMHPVYKKYVRVRNKYKAHDALNQYKPGDRVEIMEHRPISREKRWTVTRLVSRPVEA